MQKFSENIFLLLFIPCVVSFITTILSSTKDKKNNVFVKFKDSGIEEQKLLLCFWYDILCIGFKKTIIKYKNVLESELKLIKKEKVAEDVDVLYVINEKMCMYASGKTVKAMGNYMQWSFKPKEQKSDYKYSEATDLFLISDIISKLKKDFSGEKISPMAILRLKIKDYYSKNYIKYWFCYIRSFFTVYKK